MKIKVELKVKMGQENIAGTGCKGYLPKQANYSDVCKVFGQPQYLDETTDDKTKAEWTGRINDLIFTIYDYKSEKELNQNKDWHIGGHNEITAELIIEYFKSKIKELKKNEIRMA